MGKPAARIGDGHICPMVTPGTGTPHTGGPIIGPGCETVLIEGIPAATEGDVCACVGATDKITSGSTGVFIGGKPAARAGDKCEHGGLVIGGSGMVLIGESMGRNFLWLPCVWEDDGIHIEPAKEEKIAIVKKVISDCIDLLEKRLKLLEQDDPKTLEGFEKWFGYFDEERKVVILKRIKKQIVFFKELGLDKFSRIVHDEDYKVVIAQALPSDSTYTIYLGNRFWDTTLQLHAREIVLIHEISHFKKIGRTIDFGYDDECMIIVKKDPDKALYNADSYAFFITNY